MHVGCFSRLERGACSFTYHQNRKSAFAEEIVLRVQTSNARSCTCFGPILCGTDDEQGPASKAKVHTNWRRLDTFTTPCEKRPKRKLLLSCHGIRRGSTRAESAEPSIEINIHGAYTLQWEGGGKSLLCYRGSELRPLVGGRELRRAKKLDGKRITKYKSPTFSRSVPRAVHTSNRSDRSHRLDRSDRSCRSENSHISYRSDRAHTVDHTDRIDQIVQIDQIPT